MAQGLIRENIRITGSAGQTRLLARDATRPGPCEGAPATLVFLDPPYGKALGEKALAAAVAADWISEGAVIVWEDASPQDPPAGFTPLDQRRFGDTYLTFLRFGENSGSAPGCPR
jgi:16S rRNA (guanine966-N2)-methyltransferase